MKLLHLLIIDIDWGIRKILNYPKWIFKTLPQLKREFQIGKIYERCDLHIGIAIAIDYYDDSILIKSIFNGSESYCSLKHCGVREVPPDEAYDLINLYYTHGMPAIIENYSEVVDEEECK